MPDDDPPDVYRNTPLGDRQAHLFRGDDVRDATLVDGVTDEPVRSICGLVNSYGEFTPGTGDGACENCQAKLDTNQAND